MSSFARSGQPVTRAQVKSELVQTEKTGYPPTTDDRVTYPVQVRQPKHAWQDNIKFLSVLALAFIWWQLEIC